jgi:hypothetical protein
MVILLIFFVFVKAIAPKVGMGVLQEHGVQSAVKHALETPEAQESLKKAFAQPSKTHNQNSTEGKHEAAPEK